MDIWQLGLLISKFGVYLGVSALLGGGWILCITNTDTDTKFTLPASLQTTVTRHMRLFAVIGIIFSAFDFLFQVVFLANLSFFWATTRSLRKAERQTHLARER